MRAASFVSIRNSIPAFAGMTARFAFPRDLRSSPCSAFMHFRCVVKDGREVRSRQRHPEDQQFHP
jgi:hypothetical protein